MLPKANVEKIAFVVDEYGRATLYCGNIVLQEVDECSGLGEAIDIFNKLMKQRHLSYRLASGFTEMFKEILESK